MNAPPNSDPRTCGPLIDGLLHGCSQTVIDAIVGAAQVRTFAAGATLFNEGEHVTGVFLHCSGDVAIEINIGSQRHEVSRSRPGMVLGYREPERVGDYIVTCVAVSDAALYFIPIDVFLAQLHTSPPLVLNVMKTLSERIDGLEEKLHP